MLRLEMATVRTIPVVMLAVAMVGTPAVSAHRLAPIGTLVDGQDGVEGLDAAFDVSVSPDGMHVYVASYLDDAVAVFSRGDDGALTFVHHLTDADVGVDGLNGAYGVAISPDGAHLYVASLDDNAVAAFTRDGGDGSLTFVEAEIDGVGSVDGLRGASAVVVSPDGAHVYATSFWEHSVVVFERNAITGHLTWIQTATDGVGGIVGLEHGSDVAISPDGLQVYATGQGGDGVVVFSRDPMTGIITWLESELDGVGGVDGLDAAVGVAISPDGASVYVTGKGDSAIAWFDRDAVTGALTYVDALFSTQGNLGGLIGANGVAVSPEGDLVVTSARSGSAIVVFDRHQGTGTLSKVETFYDGNPLDGLDDAVRVDIAPDAGSLYAVGSSDNAVVAFRIMLFGDDFESAALGEWSAAQP
jgi:6-phosphogluconolactonase (cycloisomerase 2 family)